MGIDFCSYIPYLQKKKIIIIKKSTVKMLQKNKLVEERTECEVGKSEVES